MGDSDSDSDQLFYSAASDESTDSESSAEREKRERDDAGNTFAELIINQYLDGHMSALVLCVLCYWATKSGACGFANELAFAPGKQVGKYSRKVKKTLGFDRDECRLSPMFVPGHSKYDLSRSPQRILGAPTSRNRT